MPYASIFALSLVYARILMPFPRSKLYLWSSGMFLILVYV